MTDFWNSWWAFAFMLTPFVIGLSGVAIGVYIACSRHFNIMLSALPNSAWVSLATFNSSIGRIYLAEGEEGPTLK